MSPANVSYVLEHNPEILESRVEVAPNSLELVEAASNPPVTCVEDLPNSLLSLLPSCLVDSFLTGKPVFIYGGNLGVPQGIPFLIECLEANAERDDCHFLVVGTGTYSQRLADWYETRKPKAVSVMKGLPKEYYDMLVQVCQVGLIFLDYRFTIPNFPSRLLSYLEYKMPIIACTDSCSDIGSIAESNGFGFYVPSNNVESFSKVVTKMLSSDMVAMGKKGYQYLKENYLVENTYNQIMKHL
jgi:glycosyltransferase involved in cell wall biosynthesis